MTIGIANVYKLYYNNINVYQRGVTNGLIFRSR